MEFLLSLSLNNRQSLHHWHMCTDLGMKPSPKQVLTGSISLPGYKIALTESYNQVSPWLRLKIHCIFHCKSLDFNFKTNTTVLLLNFFTIMKLRSAQHGSAVKWQQKFNLLLTVNSNKNTLKLRTE